MTNQELYSTVRTHLLTQNRRSLSSDGHCVYRSSDGLRCAIGCLIPDDKYEADMENRPVSTSFICKAAGIDPDLLPLADELQRLHDNVFPEDWLDRLNAIAIQHDLEAR